MFVQNAPDTDIEHAGLRLVVQPPFRDIGHGFVAQAEDFDIFKALVPVQFKTELVEGFLRHSLGFGVEIGLLHQDGGIRHDIVKEALALEVIKKLILVDHHIGLIVLKNMPEPATDESCGIFQRKAHHFAAFFQFGQGLVGQRRLARLWSAIEIDDFHACILDIVAVTSHMTALVAHAHT